MSSERWKSKKIFKIEISNANEEITWNLIQEMEINLGSNPQILMCLHFYIDKLFYIFKKLKFSLQVLFLLQNLLQAEIPSGWARHAYDFASPSSCKFFCDSNLHRLKVHRMERASTFLRNPLKVAYRIFFRWNHLLLLLFDWNHTTSSMVRAHTFIIARPHRAHSNSQGQDQLDFMDFHRFRLSLRGFNGGVLVPLLSLDIKEIRLEEMKSPCLRSMVLNQARH